MTNGLDFYDLGKVICQKIRDYHEKEQEKILNEIFVILLDISKKTVFKDYRNVSDYILDETAHQIAEDALLTISQNPERFINDNESFYPYYKYIIKSRMGKVFSDFYAYTIASVSLDVCDEEEFNYCPDPGDLLERTGRFKIFIREVSSLIDACPRYTGKSKYLTWPLILSLILEGDMFGSLDFRDRVALRVMLTLVEKKKLMLREFYYDRR